MSTHLRTAHLRRTAEDLLLAVTLIAALAASELGHLIRATGRRLAPVSERLTIKSMAVSTATVLFGVLVAVTGTSGTFAYLNAQAKVGTTTVTAGNAALTVVYNGGSATSSATIPDSVWSTMLPGDAITQEVTLGNPSDTKLAVTARLGALGYYEVRTVAGTCAAATIPAAALTTTGTALTTLVKGASTVVCVQVKLSTSAPSNLQPGSASPIAPTAFQLVFDGTQVL